MSAITLFSTEAYDVAIESDLSTIFPLIDKHPVFRRFPSTDYVTTAIQFDTERVNDDGTKDMYAFPNDMSITPKFVKVSDDAETTARVNKIGSLIESFKTAHDYAQSLSQNFSNNYRFDACVKILDDDGAVVAVVDTDTGNGGMKGAPLSSIKGLSEMKVRIYASDDVHAMSVDDAYHFITELPMDNRSKLRAANIVFSLGLLVKQASDIVATVEELKANATSLDA